MQKICLTFITVACAVTILFLTLNFRHRDDNIQSTLAVSVTNPIEIIFEHTLNQESFVLYRPAGEDQLSLAFFNHTLRGIRLIDTATQYDIAALTEASGFNYVVLPRSPAVPYTIFAGFTTDPQIHEVIVTEPNFIIAHGIRVFESDICGIYAWMAISPDFIGEHYSIIALTPTGSIVGDIENNGVQRVIHTLP